ncbi:MAG TPA: sugar ABC transporter permease [Candidatus Bathyarchaeia archaeon]|nr:sugar ABC transporter permease [Candidatus Bathyarchaeia archaeon]
MVLTRPAAAAPRARGLAWHHINRVQERLLAYALILPVALLIVGLIAYPFLNAIWLSLTEKMVGYPARFVGLNNYIALWESSRFRIVAWNSVVYTVGSITTKVVIGLAMAAALQKAVRGNQLLRGFLLLPWVIPTVVIALTWRWLLDLYRGLVNVSLLDLGLIKAGFHWLGNPDLAMLSVIMANVWRGFPFFGVSFLAAMQTVPQDLYDAASVDGASAWQQFWRISLPSIKGVVAIVTLLSTIWTLNDFNIVYIMTRGGPGAATHIFATYSYELGIQSQRWGMAMAASMYSLPVIALLIVFVVRYLHRDEAGS